MNDETRYLSEQAAKGAMSRRAFLGRAAALGATAAFANSLLAGAVRAQSPVKGGILKAGMQGGSATDSLDPAILESQVAYFFSRQWGEQLVQIDSKGELQPALAEEWGSSQDAKTWTFKIRKGVQFHNGKEMTPADVLATIERHSDSNSKSGAFGNLQAIDKVAVDGQNVVFTLKEANADLPFLMDDYHLLIQPNGGKDNPTEGIGTGPYKIVANEVGVRLRGEKFANYWRDDRGFADQIEILVINDTTARMSALQSGQVHMINRVEPKVIELVTRFPGITIRNVSGRGHYLFLAHCNTAPFDNNDLRLALKYAIDREELVQKILMGYGSVGNDFPINKSYPLFTELEQRTYDPDKAAFHYKKSGHSGSVLLRTSDVAFPGAVDATQLYQQSAAKAGITIEVKREPGDGYWSEVWNKQPFCASYWGGRPTPDQMYSTAYYSKAEWNDSRFVNEKFDQMLFQSRAELDADKRKKLYADMGQTVRDEGGAIIPMFNDFIDATGPQVGGWFEDGNQEMMGGYALSKCWLEA
ncbi:MAG: ABC transporter substrate-binding protein [Mesorhizobium sp.]|uniref:ABC transporter substrate-binding protein n=1 Tax=Mesorhizobium sp. TaxID=1871066 RepID=UPI000FE74C52|nr:ABC transporter substrate-binding protein [Mesorhizobium sp.]RWD52281.1 MAG: ABC transporter substrate-binding protein [Mesorhizobium sp.]RWE62063.1 MAG: ABC transporter substrate-binding protein [Mesorhizobium sp.]RWF12114.1 MAG: ABC transporter substrate-binding protein [Mesorhizobium sp.]RWF22425.1 MAG: ABC transporter substrate-binding protein [Mesorhizobium sp.]TIY06961.1 MAG: ABC transporter substrate-binding protein [Mesorhizobium sp.]